MAREQIISRTIKRNKVTAKIINIETGEMLTEDYHISLRKTKPKKIMKTIEEELPENMIVVGIVRQEYVEGVYQMSLDKFIKNAKTIEENGGKRHESGI